MPGYFRILGQNGKRSSAASDHVHRHIEPQMPFTSRPLNTSRINRAVKKNPALFGVPFILLMVAASYGLTTFTQTRYDLHDQKVKQVTKEQELRLDKNRKRFDIREEYFRLSAAAEEDWEPKRIQRPKGLPEWGVPPTEPPSKKS